jgi:hypothetical protein
MSNANAGVWDGLLRAVGTEPRPAREIQGISGVTHRPLAIGVDESTSRLVVITDEPTPRHAAMMQVDLAATLSDVRVSVARAIPFDLQSIARKIVEQYGGIGAAINRITAISKDAEAKGLDLKSIGKDIDIIRLVDRHVELIKRVPFGKVNMMLHLVEQLRLIEMVDALETIKKAAETDPSQFLDAVRVEKLATTDLITPDREIGICPLMMPAFSEKDVEVLSSAATEDARQILKEKRIYQYFYPGQDDLVLGFVDRGVNQRDLIADRVNRSPQLGHPHGENEIVGETQNVMDVIDELQGRGLAVEGAIGFELGPNGLTRRAEVRFKPSEGVMTKILNRVSLNVNIGAEVSRDTAETVTKLIS